MAMDLAPSLFSRLSMCVVVSPYRQRFKFMYFSRPEEIITPHQTTLLKLVDSYLQSARMSPTTPQGTPIYAKLRPMLAKSFFSLSTYAQSSIRDSLEIPSGTASKQQSVPSAPQVSPDVNRATFEPPSSLDVMLPKVSEALVLVTQCIVTITLESSDAEDNSQDFFNEARFADQGKDQGIVENLTGKSFFHRYPRSSGTAWH